MTGGSFSTVSKNKKTLNMYLYPAVVAWCAYSSLSHSVDCACNVHRGF